ncbi:MAG: zinc-binding dehydrogenase [Pseudomonadota bacterium]|nr:zinc-binding dehydrogenase [Pseudomonadota bacterium]
MDAIWSLAAEGVTRPRVHREFPLDQAVAAMAELRDRRVIGKAVVRCDR